MKLLLLGILSVLLLLASAEPDVSSRRRRYRSIFSFGDTFTDTGNGRVVYAENSVPDPTARPPYGQTFFRRPTGRSTDGRLIVDFIAQKLGLPLVPPSLSHNASFRHGANFAVSAATALDVSFFKDTPIASMLVLDTSLNVQLKWFESLRSRLCSPAQACPSSFFRRSLFLMGEFGVNDYSFSVLGKTMPQVRSMVPDVVRTIAMATEGLIRHGARTVVVPGIPPLGCMPPNLVFFPSADPAGYEPLTGCLKDFNDLAVLHNTLLQEALKIVRKDHPRALVVYADFFTPVIEMVKSPGKFGLTKEILKCCCGGGGKYNFNISAGCGMADATVCKNPSKYLFWDGHFTEAANSIIAKGWLNKLNTHSQLMEATSRYFDTARDSA